MYIGSKKCLKKIYKKKIYIYFFKKLYVERKLDLNDNFVLNTIL